jgi:large subunit ribosomal protein L35
VIFNKTGRDKPQKLGMCLKILTITKGKLMPKLKTHKGTAKRIKITGSGKLVRERAFGNHILAKKSKARKRNMKTAATINGKINKNIKKALGV